MTIQCMSLPGVLERLLQGALFSRSHLRFASPGPLCEEHQPDRMNREGDFLFLRGHLDHPLKIFAVVISHVKPVYENGIVVRSDIIPVSPCANMALL